MKAIPFVSDAQNAGDRTSGLQANSGHLSYCAEKLVEFPIRPPWGEALHCTGCGTPRSLCVASQSPQTFGAV